MPKKYNERKTYCSPDCVSISHADGSSVWADLTSDGSWFIWVHEGNSHEKCPVGVYEWLDAQFVIQAISDALM